MTKQTTMNKEITINGLDSINEAAKEFVNNMGDAKVFAFYGKMGAGKTTFIKAICDCLGVVDTVTSPTFAIVNEYQSDTVDYPIYHFDFYRIKKLEEVYDMGYEDYFYGGGICLIEWPELIEDLLPEDAVHVDIKENEDGTRSVKVGQGKQSLSTMNTENQDEQFMRKALVEAQAAFDEGEIPVGAIVVCRGRIISRAHNLTETLTDVTAHAEMQAITAAANALGGKYLTDCTLYVTVEPCPMCAGAIGWAQIPRIVYGAPDEKRGYHKFAPDVLHPKATAIGGVLEEECRTLMQEFFKKRR